MDNLNRKLLVLLNGSDFTGEQKRRFKTILNDEGLRKLNQWDMLKNAQKDRLPIGLVNFLDSELQSSKKNKVTRTLRNETENYVFKESKRALKLYIPEVVRLKNEGRSIKEAIRIVSKQNDLNESSLKTSFHSEVFNGGQHNNSLLTLEQEHAVLITLQSYSMCELPLKGPDIAYMIKKVYNIDVGKDYPYRFINKYKKYLYKG
jgi:hypothetical protein